MENQNKSIMPTIKKMALYSTETFDLKKMQSVRTSCSIVHATTGKIFKTSQNAEGGTIEVVRIN